MCRVRGENVRKFLNVRRPRVKKAEQMIFNLAVKDHLLCLKVPIRPTAVLDPTCKWKNMRILALNVLHGNIPPTWSINNPIAGIFIAVRSQQP
jgi:hypothetical protein